MQDWELEQFFLFLGGGVFMDLIYSIPVRRNGKDKYFWRSA